MSQDVINLISDDEDESFGAESSVANEEYTVPTHGKGLLPRIVTIESLAYRDIGQSSKKCAKQNPVKPSTSRAAVRNGGNSNLGKPSTSSAVFENNATITPVKAATPQAVHKVEPPSLGEPPVKRSKLDNESSSTSLARAENLVLFKEFITACVKFESNEQDGKLVEEKLQSYFDRTSSEYTNSEEFGTILKELTQTLTTDRLYYCIKTIKDELKRNWLSKKIKPTPIPGTSKSTPSTSNDEDEPDEIAKTLDEKRVNKLMKALDKIDMKIKKLEEHEVDLDDDYNSSYLKMSRYRNRFAKVYKKFCELTGAPLHAERISKKKLRFNATSYPKVNLLIERWINKKRMFPDYSDVYNLIKSEDLELNPSMITIVAQDAFQKIGELLQKVRKVDYWDSVQGLVSDDRDPAKEDAQLAAALEENRKRFKKEEQAVFDSFVKRQMETETKTELEPDENEESEEEEKDNSDVSSQCSVELDEITDLESAVTENADSKMETEVSENNSEKPVTESNDSKMDNENIPEKLENNLVQTQVGEKAVTESSETKIKSEIEKNGRRSLSKPFGCAGEIIIIDYCFIHYNISFGNIPFTSPFEKKLDMKLKKNMRRKHLNKNLNFPFGPKKWLSLKIKEIIEKFYNSLVLPSDNEAEQEEPDKTNEKKDFL